MTPYRQSGTLNFIKSYVLNNWEYIFFPHRKVKKEWCVFFFHLECWWHFSIHRRLFLILISVRQTLENYTDFFLCVVNFLIFVTLWCDDVVAELFGNKHVLLCSRNDASSLQQNLKWEYGVMGVILWFPWQPGSAGLFALWKAVGSGHFDTCQYLLRPLGWQFLSTALQFMPNLKFQSFAVPAAFNFHSL